VTFTVVLSNTTATGTITLFDGTATIGTNKLSNGQAVFSTSLSGGKHTITANYSGDNTFKSTFASLVVTATVTKLPTTISITSSPNPTVYPGGNGSTIVTVTATIVPPVSGPDAVGFYATNNAANSGPTCHVSPTFPRMPDGFL
jgi:hypothetical protein